MRLEDLGDKAEAALHLRHLGFKGNNLLAVLGGGTRYSVVDLRTLVLLVLGKKDQLLDSECAVVVLLVLFLIELHVVL